MYILQNKFLWPFCRKNLFQKLITWLAAISNLRNNVAFLSRCKMQNVGQVRASLKVTMPILGKIRLFLENPLRPICELDSPLPSCKKSEKTNDRIKSSLERNFILGPFLAQICWIRFFLENPLRPTCKVDGLLVSCKKSEKTNGGILRKVGKTLILGHFWPFLAQICRMRFFFKNQASSLFWYYRILSWCKISEKLNEPLTSYRCDGRTDGQTDRQTDRRTAMIS